MTVITGDGVDTPVHVDAELGIAKPFGTLVMRCNGCFGGFYRPRSDVEVEGGCTRVDEGILPEIFLLGLCGGKREA